MAAYTLMHHFIKQNNEHEWQNRKIGVKKFITMATKILYNAQVDVSCQQEMKKKENQIVKLIFLSFFWAMIYQFVIGKSLCRRKLLTLWMQRFSDRCWIQSIFNANKLVLMLQFVIRFNFFGVSCNLSTARSFNGVCR